MSEFSSDWIDDPFAVQQRQGRLRKPKHRGAGWETYKIGDAVEVEGAIGHVVEMRHRAHGTFQGLHEVRVEFPNGKLVWVRPTVPVRKANGLEILAMEAPDDEDADPDPR